MMLDSRVFRYTMRGARLGFCKPLLVFDWFRTQLTASPYWMNMTLMFWSMMLIMVTGKGAEKMVARRVALDVNQSYA